ncbi:hypothetical protein ACNF42_00070 [Cuniculiplasma sp. SKW3]|uniref:hypothetical protein n=1 Tax=Cuniculiplasma sp. SKW3 TaxID=3400170 RepID=UPI003FD2EB8A
MTGIISEQTLIEFLRTFKIQFYVFLLIFLILIVVRVLRAKVGKTYSKKIILYPLVYMLMTLYSSITLTLIQFEISMSIYVFGFISGFIIGDLSEFKDRKGREIYQSSGSVALAWSILFLVKWYYYLYDPSMPSFFDPVITVVFTFLAGILLGESIGIIFKHFRSK